MSYKMVVMDLDGTLLNNEKKISRNDVDALNILHEKGIKIVVATGRNYYMAKNLTEQIKNISPVILANNGAVVRRSDTDELIEHNYLPGETFQEIYNVGLKHKLYPVLHVDEYENGYDMLFEHEDTENIYLGYIKKGDTRARQVKFSPKDVNNILSACYFEEFERLSEFSTEVSSLNRGSFNSICIRNISRRALLEFLHVDGCKWRALKKYINMLSIKPEEVISLGDDNNDIEMLLNSGMGIAMKNGTESAIKAGRIVSEFDNNNSGVSYELNKLFKIKY